MMNRLPERGHIQETSLIKGIPRGKVITAEDQRIIRTQSWLEDLSLIMTLKGQWGEIPR